MKKTNKSEDTHGMNVERLVARKPEQTKPDRLGQNNITIESGSLSCSAWFLKWIWNFFTPHTYTKNDMKFKIVVQNSRDMKLGILALMTLIQASTTPSATGATTASGTTAAPGTAASTALTGTTQRQRKPVIYRAGNARSAPRPFLAFQSVVAGTALATTAGSTGATSTAATTGTPSGTIRIHQSDLVWDKKSWEVTPIVFQHITRRLVAWCEGHNFIVFILICEQKTNPSERHGVVFRYGNCSEYDPRQFQSHHCNPTGHDTCHDGLLSSSICTSHDFRHNLDSAGCVKCFIFRPDHVDFFC